MLYQGFVLFFLYRGFVLIFYFEALASYYIIYYFGIYRGVFCVDLMSDRLSLPHFYCVI